MHFAEINGAQPGQRVFDVKLQGKTVIHDLDIAREAGPNRALVKEISNVKLSRAVFLDFIPKAKTLTPKTAPILSGVEIDMTGD